MRGLLHSLLGIGLLTIVHSALGQPPEMTPKRADVKPFEYKDAKVPYYAPKFGAKGGPLTKMQLPLEPAESMKHFVHPTDFELKLFVSEPAIKRPICMNWDERGRLWVIESVDYPNERRPEGQGRDRIVICEDTNGDGVADKFTVFADKLSIPTGFTFANGGVIVVQAPHTLFLKSSKGNDVADVRKILFSGWGAGDTHAGPSNLHYGFDNWIYGIVGYSGFSGTVGGEKHKFGQGFFRFKLTPESPGTAVPGPSVRQLEFLRSTNNNSWGVGFSEEGLLFGSTANGNPSVFMPIPNRYYEKVRGMSASVLPTIATSNKFDPITEKVRQVDWHGGFTAAAGHALYTARTYPKQYWNRVAFVTEPTGHLVASFVLDKSGATFSAKNSWNLLASDDEWSAPIMAEVGPDGNVWVIDWYNYIVQHNPTPPGFKTGKGNAYDTDLRDKTHGRVYRLVMKAQGQPSLGVPELKTPVQLVAALKNDNLFWRKHAQRLLIERGNKEAVPALFKLLADPTIDETGFNAGAVHAAWTLHAFGALEKALFPAEASSMPELFAVANGIAHRSPGVRRNTVLALPRSELTDALISSSKLLADNDPQVRLATLLTLADIPQRSHKAADLLREAAQEKRNLEDRYLRDALVMAAAADALSFLKTQAQDKKPDPAYLDIVRIVASHNAASKDHNIEALLASLAKADPDYIDAVLEGTLKGWPKGRTFKADAKVGFALKEVFLKVPASSKSKVIRLAGLLNVAGFDKQLVEIASSLLKNVSDDKQADAARLAAAQQLLDLQPSDAKLVETLLDLITPRSSPAFNGGMLEAIGNSPTSLGVPLLKRMPSFTPQARTAALRLLLSRPDSTRQFLDAVEKGTLTLSELPLDQKQALASHPDAQIAKRAKALLAKGGGLPNADRQKVVEEFVPHLKKTGDVALGKAVFKKHCSICHMHSGEGTKIGPDLSGVAVHTKEHLLIDILDPSRAVEGNFRVYLVETKKGMVLTGLLASETKTTIELIDTQAKKIVVERDDIDTITASNKSVMPDGFEKQLKQEELLDLLEFLTARGKFVPIALDKAATIISTQGMFYKKDAIVERLVLPDWSPRTVKGVPFHLVDPAKDTKRNAIMLYSKNGEVAAMMPKSAKLECNMPARAIHLLSGVSGWGYPYGKEGGVTLIVRLHYADGKTEDHPLLNGVHFADYIRRVDVPKSEFAFAMRGQQMRYLSVTPGRDAALTAIELVKGPDVSAPIVLAVTVETR